MHVSLPTAGGGLVAVPKHGVKFMALFPTWSRGNFQEIENTVMMKKWQTSAQKASGLGAAPEGEWGRSYNLFI
jgi:hypothetical protein